ncbi:hypothetical protein [Peribacillus kribbensis]|uniref:hypothetical protein n=1 Tax=Peribacillus kribbensis TaxID=356658 RepID=UPI000415589C|nr:hypothetical protein [Peribacillus kribbensis]
MKKKYSPYSLPPWLRSLRAGCSQLIIPFCVFQGIRTFLIPTTFDVLFLALLVVLAIALRLEWI